jgi:hypothetical protein
VFESSFPFLFFDYFRIPYRVVPPDCAWLDPLPAEHPLRSCGRLHWAALPGPPRALSWPSFDPADSPLARLGRLGHYQVDAIPIYGHVLSDSLVGPWLQGHWREVGWVDAGP